MKGSSFAKAAALLSSSFASLAYAQETFTHAATGITFWRQVVSSAETAGGLEWGMALPEASTGNNLDYIGYIVSPPKHIYRIICLVLPLLTHHSRKVPSPPARVGLV